MTLAKKACKDYRIPLLAVLIFVIMSLVNKNFFTPYNIFTIADSISGYGIVALGFTFILLVGQLDISFGSVIALSACIFMMMLQAEMNFLLALLAAIAVGCACGAVTGFFVATFRLSPFIVSMTMQLAYKGIALTITNQTPVSVPHPVLQAINNIKLFNIFPIVFFFFLLLAVLTELFLRNTQFGRNLFLVGGNISVADNLGIKARNYIWSAYIFQGLFAAIGGVVMMTPAVLRLRQPGAAGPDGGHPDGHRGRHVHGRRPGRCAEDGRRRGAAQDHLQCDDHVLHPSPAAAVRQGPHSAGGHCERQIYGKKTRKSLTERNQSYEYSRSWRTSR